MLAIQMARHVADELRRLPRLARIGLTLAVAAFVADVVVHLLPAPHHHGGHPPGAHLAHLVGLLAMVLILAGVALDARRHAARRASRAAHGGPRHAHR